MKKVLKVLAILAVLVLVSSIAPKPAVAMSPWLRQIERQYVDVYATRADASGINLKLNTLGVQYGKTWTGARDLATYAVVRYYESQGRMFPRPVAYARNAVDAEIHDHCVCSWYLGLSPCNPINIGVNDRPPTWH